MRGLLTWPTGESRRCHIPWSLYDMAPKNTLTNEQKNDAEMKFLQGTCTICDSVSLSAIKREKICCSGMQISFWDILTRVMTWQHILIRNTEFRFSCWTLERMQPSWTGSRTKHGVLWVKLHRKAQIMEHFIFKTGENEWGVGRCSPVSLCVF